MKERKEEKGWRRETESMLRRMNNEEIIGIYNAFEIREF